MYLNSLTTSHHLLFDEDDYWYAHIDHVDADIDMLDSASPDSDTHEHYFVVAHTHADCDCYPRDLQIDLWIDHHDHKHSCAHLPCTALLYRVDVDYSLMLGPVVGVAAHVRKFNTKFSLALPLDIVDIDNTPQADPFCEFVLAESGGIGRAELAAEPVVVFVAAAVLAAGLLVVQLSERQIEVFVSVDAFVEPLPDKNT